MVSLLEINYVYALVVICGCVLFMALLLLFPRVVSQSVKRNSVDCIVYGDIPTIQLNIVSSSVVGSYAVVFGELKWCIFAL